MIFRTVATLSIFFVLSHTLIAQSIGLIFGADVARNSINDNLPFVDNEYRQGPKYSIGLSFLPSESFVGQVDVYYSLIDFRIKVNSITSQGSPLVPIIDVNLKYSYISFQSFFAGVKFLKHFQAKAGSMISYRTGYHISGFSDIIPLGSTLNTVNLGSRLRLTILGQLLLGTIDITDKMRLQPSYNMSYNFNSNSNSFFDEVRFLNHGLEMRLYFDLAPRVRKVK